MAYRIWLERADRPGSPEEDWLKAEAEVRAKYSRVSTSWPPKGSTRLVRYTKDVP